MPALRCPSCNKFRSAEEFDVDSVELEDISTDGKKLYGDLTATINVVCPECGEVIGTFECQGVEVTLGDKDDIQPSD